MVDSRASRIKARHTVGMLGPRAGHDPLYPRMSGSTAIPLVEFGRIIWQCSSKSRKEPHLDDLMGPSRLRGLVLQQER